MIILFACSFLGLVASLLYLYLSALSSQVRRVSRRAEKRVQRLDREALCHVVSIERFQEKLRDAEEKLNACAPLLARIERLEVGLDEMRRVWLGGHIQEGHTHDGSARRWNQEACRRVLCDNLWVLEPDYALRGGYRLVDADVIPDDFSEFKLRGGVCRAREPLSRAKSNGARRETLSRFAPAMAGWTSAHGLMASDAMVDGRPVYLILDLHHSLREVTPDCLESVRAFAEQLVETAPEHFGGKRIEGLVVGGRLAEGVSEQMYWSEDQRQPVLRLTPVTYEALYARALAIVHADTAMRDGSEGRKPAHPLTGLEISPQIQ